MYVINRVSRATFVAAEASNHSFPMTNPESQINWNVKLCITTKLVKSQTWGTMFLHKQAVASGIKHKNVSATTPIISKPHKRRQEELRMLCRAIEKESADLVRLEMKHGAGQHSKAE